MSSPEYWLGRGGGFLGTLLGGLFQRGASKNYARSFDTLRTNSKHRKEAKDLRALFARLDREPGALEKQRTLLVQQVLMEAGDPQTIPPQITESITKLLTDCFIFEGTFAVPQTHGRELSIGEIWELRDRLNRLVAIVERPEALNRLSGTLRALIRNLVPPTLPLNSPGGSKHSLSPSMPSCPIQRSLSRVRLGYFSMLTRNTALSLRFAKRLRGTCCESPALTQHAPRQAQNNS
jgi:hypothetical protein